MNIEQVRSAGTVEEMRAEIFRLRHHESLVRQVIDAGNYSGQRAEDTYTALAYYALLDRQRFMKQCLAQLNVSGMAWSGIKEPIKESTPTGS